jgi:hypothetical protein
MTPPSPNWKKGGNAFEPSESLEQDTYAISGFQTI